MATKEKNHLKQVQVDFPSLAHKPLQIKPLTPTTLLATLFLLPSPFPPSYASATSSSQPPTTSTDVNNNTASASMASPSVAPTSTPVSVPDDSSSMDLKDLLLLASQPLLRGAGYIPYLGPTGNVGLVLAARRLIWEVLSALAGLELSSSRAAAPSVSVNIPAASKRRGRSSKNKSVKGKGSLSSNNVNDVDLAVMGDDDKELDEAQQDIRDAEDYRKVLECVHSILDGWKRKFKDEGKVLPPGAEVDDGIVIKEGLVTDVVLLSRPIVDGTANGGVSAGSREDRSGDVDMVDGTKNGGGKVEVEVEESISLRSGLKRKRVDDGSLSRKRGRGKGKEKAKEAEEEGGGEITPEEEEMLLRVDWACPCCGGLL